MKQFAMSLLSATVLSLGLAGGAQAGTVASQLFSGFQQLSDNSAEELIDQGGSAVGKVDVGDRLRGIFTIETVEQTGSTTRFLGGGSGNNELTGIFDVTVTGKVCAGAGVNCFFTFGSTATFATEVGVANAYVAFYEDSAIEYSRLPTTCTTPGLGGDCEGLISDVPLYWVLGTNGQVGEEWTAFAVSDDIGTIGSTPAPGNGGFFNIGLSLLLNNSGVLFDDVACGASGAAATVEFCGSGSLLGTGGVNTPYDSFDNVDFTINVVPEPTSIALSGLALLGLAAASRRRKV